MSGSVLADHITQIGQALSQYAIAIAVACYVISRLYRRDNAALFLLGLFLIYTTTSGEIAVAATLAAGMFGELVQLIDLERKK